MTKAPEQPVAPEGYKLKKKKPIYKRVWFLILAAIVVIVALKSIAGGGGDSSSAGTATTGTAAAGNSATTKAADAPAAKIAGIGTAVRDGKFEFTVSGVDCSRTSIGTSQYAKKKAQGVFCIVSMHVSNVGKEAQYFDASGQKALDAQGREFSADSGAAVYLDDANSFLEQLNPGSAVDGQLVYDVPTGTKLTQIELHDSAFSGGVKVNLG
jgi:hypothetical protein